jgi:hypothetical protein
MRSYKIQHDVGRKKVPTYSEVIKYFRETAYRDVEPEFFQKGGFYKIEKIEGDRFLQYYKGRTKEKERISPGRMFTLIDRFFKTLRNHIINNEAGVFIKGLGYFYMQQSPAFKRGRRRVNAMTHNILGRPYRMSFVAIRKDMKVGTWVIDNANILHFCGANRPKRVKNKLYKNAFTSLYAMFGSNLDIIYFKRNEYNKSDSGSTN